MKFGGEEQDEVESGVREVMMKKKVKKKNWGRRGNAPRLHLHRVGMTKGHLKSLQVNLLTRISCTCESG